MLWMLCDLREKLVRVYAYGLCNIKKFNHIQPPFAALKLRNKRLRARKALGKASLCEGCRVARLYKKLTKLVVSSCKDGLRHTSPFLSPTACNILQPDSG